MAKPAQTPAAPTDTDLLDDKGTFSGNPDDSGTPSGTKKTQAASEPPEKVKVRVGNEEIETDAASAAFMNAMMGQIQILSQQVTGMSKPPVAALIAKSDAYDYATGLFTEPEVALNKLRAEIKAEVKAELGGMYEAAETKKDFWNTFYSENADLKTEKLVVDAVLQRDYSKLSTMPIAEASAKLSDSVKKELMRLKGGKSDSDTSNKGVEGSSTRLNTPNTGQPTDSNIMSLSEIIRNRQQARRKAQFSKE